MAQETNFVDNNIAQLVAIRELISEKLGEMGTSSSEQAQAIIEAIQAIKVVADNIKIDAGTINLSTDEVEGLLRALDTTLHDIVQTINSLFEELKSDNVDNTTAIENVISDLIVSVTDFKTSVSKLISDNNSNVLDGISDAADAIKLTINTRSSLNIDAINSFKQSTEQYFDDLLAKLGDIITTLNTNNAAAITKITENTTRVVDKENEISNKVTQFQTDAINALDTLNTSITTFRTKYEIKIDGVKSLLESNHTELITKLDETKIEQHADSITSNEKLDNIKTAIETFNTDEDTRDSGLKKDLFFKLDNAITLLEDIKNSNDVNDELLAAINNIKLTAESISLNADSINLNTDQVEAKLDDIIVALGTYTGSGDGSSMRGLLLNLQNILNSISTSIASSNNKLDETNAKLDIENTNSAANKTAIAAIKSELESVADEVAINGTNIEDIKLALGGNNEDTIKAAIDNITSKLANGDGSIAVILSAIKTLLNSALYINTTSVTEYIKGIQQYSVFLSTINDRLNDIKNLMADVLTHISTTNSLLSDIKTNTATQSTVSVDKESVVAALNEPGNNVITQYTDFQAGAGNSTI